MCVPFSFDFMDFNFRKLLENQSSNRFSYISIRVQLSFETIPLYNIFFSNLFLWLEFKLQQKKKEMNNPSLKRHKDYPREEEDIGQS
jgi:hypothetical protein